VHSTSIFADPQATSAKNDCNVRAIAPEKYETQAKRRFSEFYKAVPDLVQKIWVTISSIGCTI